MNFTDPVAETEIKAFHHGVERARLITPPRPRDPLDVLGETPRPAARERFQSPKITAAEADAEIEFDLAEASMLGVI